MRKTKPFIVLIGGIMASGKNTLGQMLQAKLRKRESTLHFIDIDEVSRDGNDRLLADIEPELLRDGDLWNAYIELYLQHLTSGESGVFVGTFREREKRQELTRFAKQAGYSVFGVFFDYTPEHVIPRAIQRAKETNGAHLLKEEDAEPLIRDWREKFDAQFHPDLENGAWMVLRDPHIPIETVLATVITQMEQLPGEIRINGRERERLL